MTASWTAVIVAIIVALASFGRALLSEGKRAGKMDTLLEQLTFTSTDHEGRIRALEDTRKPQEGNANVHHYR